MTATEQSPCFVCCCSAVLAHLFLKEQLNIFGILGCVLCITGSLTIVMHVPAEQPIESVTQVWNLAMQPGEHLTWHQAVAKHLAAAAAAAAAVAAARGQAACMV